MTVQLTDRRGKHNQHPKIGPEIREKVRVHISSFPKQQSHYSREQTGEQNSTRCYLGPNLTVRRMWFLYLIQNDSEQVTILQNKEKCTAEVKLHLYREEFPGMNLGFGLPRPDTCIKCDKNYISVNGATMTGDQARLSQLLI